MAAVSLVGVVTGADGPSMHPNSTLLFQKYATDCFRDGMRVLEIGPAWLRTAAVLERIENYLRSGTAFVYLQAPL